MLGLILYIGLYFMPCLYIGNSVMKHESTQQPKEENTLSLCKDEFSQDMVEIKSYQTFDEFTMRGVGTPNETPHVNVRRYRDSIFVSSSDVNDSIRLYIRRGDDIWYNHMEYDMWKKYDLAEKSEEGRIARMYDRYIYNDTITELRTAYLNGNPHIKIYVKLLNKMYVINPIEIDSSTYSNINKFRTYVFDILHSKTKDVWEYELKESENTYSYVGVRHNYSYSYPKKPYGFWGIQPGEKETFLYEGIDIREYADNLRSFQSRNPDSIYVLADKMPEFPGGYDLMQAFIKKKRNNSLITNKYLVVEAIVEKNGCITNAVISKSIDSVHDEDALRIINAMPRWKPGILNGKKVRCKIKIPVSYR